MAWVVIAVIGNKLKLYTLALGAEMHFISSENTE